MKTLQFPPVCARTCGTYLHLKRIRVTMKDRLMVCKACISWNPARRKKRP